MNNVYFLCNIKSIGSGIVDEKIEAFYQKITWSCKGNLLDN
jgi:hypothetical protein